MDKEPLKEDIVNFLEESPTAVLTGTLAVSLFLKEGKETEIESPRLALTTYLTVLAHRKSRKNFARSAAQRYRKITGDHSSKIFDLYEKFYIYYFEIFAPAIKELIESSKIGRIKLKESYGPRKPTSSLLFDKERPELGEKMKSKLESHQSRYRERRLEEAEKYIEELKDEIEGLQAVIGKGSAFNPGQNPLTMLSDVDFAVYVKGYSRNERRDLKEKLTEEFGDRSFKEKGVRLEFLCAGIELIKDQYKNKNLNKLIQRLKGVYFYSTPEFKKEVEKIENETGEQLYKSYSSFINSL